MATHELAELLRAAGVDVRSNLSSVEESDVTAVLSSGTPKETEQPAKRSAKKPADEKPAAAEAKARVPVAAPQEAAPEAKPPKAPSPRSKKPDSTAPKAAESSAEPSRSRPAPTPEEAAPAKTGAPKPGGEKSEAAAPRPDRPTPAKKPPRPRGRRPRLDDMPTVVGPGVPLRKGVKPPDTVHVKGQEPPPKKQVPAAKPQGTGAGKVPRRPGDPDKPAPAAGDAGPRRARDDDRPAGAKTAAAPAAAPAAGDAAAAGRRPATTDRAGRPRRGEERSPRRRVVIDSQAGRKGAKGPARGDSKGVRTAEGERAPVKPKVPPGTEVPVTLASGATVKDFAEAFELIPGDIIKKLMMLGDMVTITQSLSDEAIIVLAEDFERKVEIKRAEDEAIEQQVFEDDPKDLVERAPVVTVMGHVDHGKTSLLDAIRETAVVSTEAGGITQHIGAYRVEHNQRQVTFIDTPGHEAFTAMRARGAKITDIAVIVVAANDGVMPQTQEAISHARAAEVPMLVAINKIDLPDSNLDKVKKELADEGLVPEEWGGDTVMVEVSAKQRINLTELMDMILLVADVQEVRANPNAEASGYIIEAQLDVGRGPVATLLVQRGTLRVGDAVVCGDAHGKVKAMFDFIGAPLEEAGPSVPVQILGFDSVPTAGDFAQVVKDDRVARQRAEAHSARVRMEELAKSRAGATTLDEFYLRLKEGQVKELALIIKGDVDGSVEALEEALANVSHPEAKVVVIHSGVGGVNESDIRLASASNAVVIGFNVRPSTNAKSLAEQEGVEVRTYRVIYKAIEDVQAALVGMLEPEHVEQELGTAEVRQTFKASKIGTIAGCYIQTGKVLRNAKVRVVRGGSIVYEGSIESLRRFAEDAREVATGYECGIHLDGYNDLKEGDTIEAYEIKEVARTS
jgi:translation initiation factor IF-2